MSREKGNIAEKIVVSFLEKRNFNIIETNFYAKKLREIDIIAKKGEIYHFCEVKSGIDYEAAILNLTSKKLSKIKKSVEYYLQTKNLNPSFCIDAIIINNNEVELIENITI